MTRLMNSTKPKECEDGKHDNDEPNQIDNLVHGFCSEDKLVPQMNVGARILFR